MNLIALKTELTSDPLTRGYAGMDEFAAAVALNTANRSVPVDYLTSAQVFECLDVAEFNGLSTANKARVDRILGLGGAIKCSAPSNARDEMLAIFGAATNTRARLAAATSKTVSRGVELGLGFVEPRDVRDARTIP